MRQQLGHAAVQVRREAREHILEVCPRIVPVELGRYRQAHDDGGTLTRQFASAEEPRLAVMPRFS